MKSSFDVWTVDLDLVPDGLLNNAEQNLRLIAELIVRGAVPGEYESFIPKEDALKDMHITERVSDRNQENTNFWVRVRELQAEGVIPDNTFVFDEPISE